MVVARHPDELLSLAEHLAREAADLLLEGAATAKVAMGTKSSPTDVVTEWDHRSEELILGALRRECPEDALLSEETGSFPGRSGLRWVVDPLDGTTNFLYGLPGFAVSIAVEDEKGTLCGVVADPVHGEVFSASAGGGARCNGEELRVSANGELASSLLATGFSYDPERRRRQAEVLSRVLPSVRDIRRFGAASVDLCWVGAGRFDGYWEGGLEPWDYAAGALVAVEAGAVVGDLLGGSPSEEAVFAAAPGIAEALRSLLRDSGATGA